MENAKMYYVIEGEPFSLIDQIKQVDYADGIELYFVFESKITGLKKFLTSMPSDKILLTEESQILN